MGWPGRREGVSQEEREESLLPGRKAGLGAGGGWQDQCRPAGGVEVCRGVVRDEVER